MRSGEREEAPGFLATVPRVGYRFSEDARPVPRPEAPAAVVPLPVAAPALEPDAERDGAARRVRRGAIALVLLAAAVRRRALGEPAPSGATPRAPAPGLLTLVREIPAPPDATALLGAVHGTAVLGAPSAIVPSSARRGAGRDAPAARRGRGRREPARRMESSWSSPAAKFSRATSSTQKARALGRLPGGVPAAREGRLLVSPRGRLPRSFARRTRSSSSRSSGAGLVPLVPRGCSRETGNEALALSDRWLAFAAGNGEPLRVFDAATGSLRLEAAFAETRVKALAIEDATGRVAAGGAFDTVHVFRLAGGPPETFAGRGWTSGLAWVPDHPTLLAAGRLGATVWRPGSGVVASAADPANDGSVAAAPDGVLVHSPDSQRLAVFAYAGFPPETKVAVSKAPLWALAHDPEGRTVFAGGRDGKLYALDVKSGAVRAEAVHTDGIPSLLAWGGRLASSSDDKTVAVWSLPGPKVVRRTRAHDFLVNDLQLALDAPGGAVLVTSSSDGTIKTWRWPSLEPLETVDLAPFAGGKVEAHALWTSPDASRVLVGTWDHAFLDLEKRNGRWTGRRVPTEAGAVYRLAGLPKLGLVAGAGIRPHEVFLLDLATGERRTLESAGLDVYWVAAEPEGDAFVAVGNGGAARYALARAADGSVSFSLVARRQSGMLLLTATLLPDGTLWAGTYEGAVLAFPPGALRGPPLAAARVEFPKK